jgi:EF hand
MNIRNCISTGVLVAVMLSAATAALGADDPATNQPLPAWIPSMRLTNDNLPHRATRPAGFDRLDANRDGSVDRPEALASRELTRRFDRLDTDHDGRLSRAEFSAIKDLASIRIDNPGDSYR